MQYTAIEAIDISILIQEVKASLALGWEPLGAPVYGPGTAAGETAWIQFMIRRDK